MSIRSAFDKGVTSQTADQLATGARYVQSMWGNLFAEYHGDVPLGLAYVRCWHETRGRAKATSSQGERGLLQLFDRDSKLLGIDNDPYHPPSNVWAGMKMWNRRSKQLQQTVPDSFVAPDADFWACSNLTMSIGKGGTIALCRRTGGGLDAIVEYIKTSPSAFTAQIDSWYKGKPSRQSAELVARRIGKTVTWMEAAKDFGPLVTTGFGTEPSRTLAKVLPVALLIIWGRK